MKLSASLTFDSLPVPTFRDLIERGQLFFEKCELRLSAETFLAVIHHAEKARRDGSKTTADDLTPSEALIEAIAAMLRLSAEAKDEESVAKWDAELERHLPEARGRSLAQLWHNRGVVATHRGNYREAQTYYFRALRAFQSSIDESKIENPEERKALEFYANLYASIAGTLMNRGLLRRAKILVDLLYRRFSQFDLAGQLTQISILQSVLAERAQNFVEARAWVQKAHAYVLSDRNWYFHLYVLWAYARLERKTQNFPQAYWYLDLISRAASGPEFAQLLSKIERERELLKGDAVDLLIDARHCEIRTRESKELRLGKQYVLIGILEALTDAHHRSSPENERGLSKAEIIERVWREKYRPESHDNKLYYNINRLRKLIEPDTKHPRYLLNWKEGYRFAPELKVQFISGESAPEDLL